MIDVYYWTTPNGHKIIIFLEEAGLPIPSSRSTCDPALNQKTTNLRTSSVDAKNSGCYSSLLKEHYSVRTTSKLKPLCPSCQ